MLSSGLLPSVSAWPTPVRVRSPPISCVYIGSSLRFTDLLSSAALPACHVPLTLDRVNQRALTPLRAYFTFTLPFSPPVMPFSSLEHKHIVRYLGTEVRDHTLYIFTEWVSGGSLEKMLQQFSRLPVKVVSKYTRQILVGLNFLHKHKVVHRDIKVRPCSCVCAVARQSDLGIRAFLCCCCVLSSFRVHG